ncbi:MAG: galactose ABC transporter substrate-binding protein [Bacillota bacterium]|nr:galactose ABC transporter substrate-binding protein [Bacillota bacterium]
MLLSGCYFSGNSLEGTKKSVIGVIVGSFDDTWRTGMRNELYKLAEGKVDISIWSGYGSQENENKKVDLLIEKKVNVLAVNLVEKTAASTIIEKAKKADIPVVFFNVEPNQEDLKKWDKVYYVGAKAEQSGSMQGQILTQYFKANPTKDGIIRYVMIKGPAEHQDAIMRTKYSVKAMEDAGLKLKLVAEDYGMWQRSKGQEIMQNFLKAYDGSIDCVIANNDDMALGAIDALKTKGYFSNGKYMPVVGVDDTSTAIKALRDGTLLGTVLNDDVGQGDAIYNLSTILADGKVPNKENYSYSITDNRYVWIEYKMINKDNIN